MMEGAVQGHDLSAIPTLVGLDRMDVTGTYNVIDKKE